MSGFIINCLVTFALTIIWTKSKIFACKRQFVINRYKSSQVGGQRPSLIHSIWHACWTCPMCSGFWVALVVSWFIDSNISYIGCTLGSFAVNWLLHCVEDLTFNMGKYFEKKNEKRA